jgi:hypothetical protein
MKKTLLLSAVAFMSIFAINAQTVWDFTAMYTTVPTTASQGITGNIGFFVNPSASTPVTTFVVEASAKTFPAGGTYAGGSLTNRLKLGGKGSDATFANPYLPTTNYVYFKVTGPCTITVFCRSSTSTATDGRILYITDGANLLGSYAPPASASDVASVVTGTYTGGAGIIYIYGYINAFNLYRVEASANVGTTFLITAMNQVLADKGISFNGTEVVNSKGLDIEVYNVLGKKVAISKTNISTTNFQKGVYVVRASGFNDSLKICI